jgi:hypothetical protein
MILATDNGPAMKPRRFRNFVTKSELLVQVRSRKIASAQDLTPGSPSRIVQNGAFVGVLPNNRTELIEAVRSYRQFYTYGGCT